MDVTVEFLQNGIPILAQPEVHEALCWGCGLCLLLSSHTSIFKCGWCGAITMEQNTKNHQSPHTNNWRRWRDRFIVFVVILFILFIICGGVWAIHPIVFSISYISGCFHSIVTAILSISTISTFSFAAFRFAGKQPMISWGSYPLVGKGSLDNYTFCSFCVKPKSPRAHHCRSCGMCILDMDHHCPFKFWSSLSTLSRPQCFIYFVFCNIFNCLSTIRVSILFYFTFFGRWIGNCVGAANHRVFIFFLISVIISTAYVVCMTCYIIFCIFPSLDLGPFGHLIGTSISDPLTLKEGAKLLLGSVFMMSTRGVLLVYLFGACFSINIGLSVLLWQQLRFIYKGKTYMDHLRYTSSESEKEGLFNIFRFFGFSPSVTKFLLGSSNMSKRHTK